MSIISLDIVKGFILSNSFFFLIIVLLQTPKFQNMSWTLKKDTLFTAKSKEIGYFLPTATEQERKMIKNGDDLIDVIGKFLVTYDEKGAVLKPTYTSLEKLIDRKINYKLIWKKSRDGELLNEDDKIIFYFVNPDSVFARLIYLLPEAYCCSQDLLNNLSSTHSRRLKTHYDKICDFYDKALEE